jgi:hypothetical protein
MARHLCIVARDNSPLYGFLTIAFSERPAGTDMLDVVLDRRRAEASRERDRQALSPGSAPPSSYTDRRRHAGVAEALQTRGYAIVAGPGAEPRASDEAFIERAVGILADVERRGPLALRFHQQRRAVGRAIVGASIGAVIVFAIIWVLTTLPTVGGLARITDDLSRWTDAGVSRLGESWTALRRVFVPTPIARESDGARARSPEPAIAPAPAPATSMIESPRASLPAPAEPERAAPALPPAPLRPALEPSRAVERPPVSARPAPRTPAAETARPAPRAPSDHEAPSRDGRSREVTSREPALLESSEPRDTRSSLTAFSGLPRVELSRQPSGAGTVYTVRLADRGGRPVPGAEVWMRGQTGDGEGRETRLDAVDPPGTYRSNPLLPGTLSPQLSVRVYFSNMRVEIPVEP